MGRYYNGDIEGKFWFAVQSSDAATRFGCNPSEPSHISYYFDEDNLDDVESEIKSIENVLGDKLKAIEDFFNGPGQRGYNDDMLNENNISGEELSEYADLLLGRQIRDCIKREGQCHFDAEL